ncbi:BppU family phage baseplate upper protein [Companilactobacillus mishanensis]|uniref:DUF2479 domain-containing protein n=1 Tax=Companilactobacillus mishanensis TaxID=2486008 RepID=A0A5P0ZF37_9LACO|nr:BppU family phage baseplate upper protein [Companilactobacillus mishanensis]MQS51660.1 DUF2479 domain-containing protein [Companilactobacillus mishanensis]
MDENISNILDQDTWLPATPDITKDGYVKIDLNKVDLVTYSFNKRFRQGENAPELHLWFYDGNIPHQLNSDTSSVTLYGLDSTDKIKVITAQPENTWQSGRVKLALPSQMFASAGQYKRCVIEVKNSDQIIATINFNLDVLPNDFYNMTFGSNPFSGQVNDEIKKTLQSFKDIATETIDQYQTLKTLADNTASQIAKNNIVTKDTFDNTIEDLNSKFTQIPKMKKYDASAFNWQDPFGSFTGMGASSLMMYDNVVFLSISTFSYKTGSVICKLPSETAPAIEKIGVGLSMDGDGHDAQPVAISIMPDGSVIVENNTHDHAKILLVTSYSTIDTHDTGSNTGSSGGGTTGGSTGTDTGNTGGSGTTTSQISGISNLVANTYITVPNQVTVYRGDGSISRTLPAKGDAYSTDKSASLGGVDVYRISTDEWVHTSDVNLIIPWTGTIRPTRANPKIVDQYGSDISYGLIVQEYAVDKKLRVMGTGENYYEISKDGFIAESDMTQV